MVATGHTRISRVVAGDGLPELSGSEPGLLPEVLANAKAAPISGRLCHERFTYGTPGENRTHDLRIKRQFGSGISRLRDFQNQKYQTVSCEKCGFTELYRLNTSGFGNVLNVFVDYLLNSPNSRQLFNQFNPA